jgi:hypothetical protein
VERDVEKALRWYRMAAEGGNAMAQLRLGLTYDDGDGVPKDQAEAAKWYLLAARQGDATAQRKLAYLYATGQGIEADAAAAFDWYGKALGQSLREAWEVIVDMRWVITVAVTMVLIYWAIVARNWARFRRQVTGPLGFRRADDATPAGARGGTGYRRPDGYRLSIVGNQFSLWAPDDSLLVSGRTYTWARPLKMIRRNLPT